MAEFAASLCNFEIFQGFVLFRSGFFIALACLSVVVTEIFVSFLSSRAFKKFIQQNACSLSVPVAPNPFPWGLRRKYEVVKLDGDLLDDYTRDKYQKNGSTHVQCSPFTGLQCGVCTIEPENYKAIFATKFQDWERPRFRAGAAKPFLGPGIFTSDGPAWHTSRSLMKSLFTRERINENILNSEKHINLLFRALGNVDSSGYTQTVNLMDYFYRFALDSATEFLFGTSAFTQLSGLSDDDSLSESRDRFMDGFEQVFKQVGSYVGVRLRLGKKYWLYDGISYRWAVRKMHRMASKYIANARSIEKERKQTGEQAGSRSLAEAIAVTGVGDDEIVNQCMHLLIAGMDTTSAALGFAFALLELNPRVVEKLRAAVHETFGTTSKPLQPLTFESLKQCSYLQWVINETLRLYPAGPVNARVAVRDTVLPVGGGEDGSEPIAVRKGSRAQVCIYLTHRNPRFWGEDAHEFKPERWEGRRKGWEYIPFSAGPQICIGQQYAMTQAAYVIAHFMMRYDRIEKVPGANNLKKGWKTVLTPGQGVKVRLHAST